ncbi:group III truncated hemoglobin [Streptomyces sp. NPDC046275]|uniref:group III truncated hemoglobin n=1 Tax=Streptomyces sp. NPDC046275 TaxID=3157201 RepID=UPI0033F01AD0
MPATRAVHDIGSRADLDALLRRFYEAAFADPLIGPFFTEIAGTDLDAHLPGIGDFWERALFRSAEYRRDAYAPHAALHAARPLTAAHFGRWVQLWRATVDGRHAGPVAERAKAQGERIALALLRRLGGPGASTDAPEGVGGSGGFVPLAALALRSVAPAHTMSGKSVGGTDEFRRARPSELS